MTDPIKRFETNIDEVKRLLEIHKQLSGGSAGRKYNVEVLNKSAIVLLVACWEAFVEDLAAAAFNFMLTNATEHTVFPDSILTLASKKLKAAADNREVWRLAGSGWRKVLEEYRDDLLKEHIGKLNTPKPKQVDTLFTALIGIPSMSAKWAWHSVTGENSSHKLTTLVELRGAIAHQVAAGKPVRKVQVTDYMSFIYRLAVISSNRTRSYLYTRTKKRAWASYKFRTTR